MIPSNFAGVLILALLIACVFGGWSWHVRRVVKFRYVVALMIVLIVVAIISAGK